MEGEEPKDVLPASSQETGIEISPETDDLVSPDGLYRARKDISILFQPGLMQLFNTTFDVIGYPPGYRPAGVPE